MLEGDAANTGNGGNEKASESAWSETAAGRLKSLPEG
jgi:hypothetical protein